MGSKARVSQMQSRNKRRKAAYQPTPGKKASEDSTRSAYGRKKTYLRSNGGGGLDYKEPKPWK